MTVMIVLNVILAVVYASSIERLLHKYVMHRPVGRFRYPFEAHTLTHHRIFKADLTYHLVHDEDKSTIPMAWWNAPVLVACATLPAALLSFATGIWTFSIVTAAVVYAYYGAYEYFHWCMHLPKSRRIERSWLFRRLNGHHLLHHRYMNKNFNVVLPLADFLFGSLMLRSPVCFAQTIGPSVPDVQPR